MGSSPGSGDMSRGAAKSAAAEPARGPAARDAPSTAAHSPPPRTRQTSSASSRCSFPMALTVAGARHPSQPRPPAAARARTVSPLHPLPSTHRHPRPVGRAAPCRGDRRPRTVDAMTPAELLLALARTRASLDGSEVTFWWTGDVHSWAPGEPYRHLFGFEGLNVARLAARRGRGGGDVPAPHPGSRLLPGPAQPRDPGDLGGQAGGARLERPGEPGLAALPRARDRPRRPGLFQPGDPPLLPLAAARRPVPAELGGRHLPGPGAVPVLRAERPS